MRILVTDFTALQRNSQRRPVQKIDVPAEVTPIVGRLR